MSETTTLPAADEQTTTGPGRYAHYVKKQRLGDAIVEGTPLEALCGYRWVPSRDPKRLPVCPECKAIFDDNEAIILARESM